MFIGVDLGGTNIAIGIVDQEGNLHYQKSIPTKKEREAKEVVKNIINLIEDIIKKIRSKKNTIKAIGIGIPGIADLKTGKVIQCINLNWFNVFLKEAVEEKLKIPVFIENDAALAGIAEYEIGSMKNVHSGVFITLGTGIGGGIIFDNKVQSGFHGIGAEIGHMIVGENYYDCSCGRNGCLETFASSTALIAYCKKLIKDGEDTILINKVNGNLNNLNGKIIFESAKEGDIVSNKAVDRLVKYLSIGIINIVSIIDPEVIVIGGGISKVGDFLLNKLRYESEKRKYFKTLPISKIVLAKLSNEAGIIGAAMLAKNNIYN